jgi:hypothetical protein
MSIQQRCCCTLKTWALPANNYCILFGENPFANYFFQTAHLVKRKDGSGGTVDQAATAGWIRGLPCAGTE